MSKILKPENLTKIAIDPSELKAGQMVAISSNLENKKTYCLVGSVDSERILFYKNIGLRSRLVMAVTADDLIEYDLRIEIL